MSVVLVALLAALCAAACWRLIGKGDSRKPEREANPVEVVRAEQGRPSLPPEPEPPVAKLFSNVVSEIAVEKPVARDDSAARERQLEEVRRAAEKAVADQLKKANEESARKAAQDAQRAEEARKLQEAEAKRQAQEEARREQAKLADEKAKKEAQAHEEERIQVERKRRQVLLQRLARGSEFLPDPPELAAGSEKRVTLPNGGWMDFIWCPPGRFLMGSPETEDRRNVDERPHLVTLTKGFWIGKTEVTRAQWKAVMGDAGFAFSSLWGGDGEFPIDTVSWQQCKEFCDKAGNEFRLPTEAEWEYACRAGTATPFDFGVSLNGTKANCSGGAEPYGTLASGPNSFGSKRVASYQRNPWGIYDMHGNLFEWCADYYTEYPDGDQTDPKGPDRGDTRVIRGGCWNFAPKMCRSAFRNRKDPMTSDTHTGFRVCCDRIP